LGAFIARAVRHEGGGMIDKPPVFVNGAENPKTER
jgi:hypothetical protein